MTIYYEYLERSQMSSWYWYTMHAITELEYEPVRLKNIKPQLGNALNKLINRVQVSGSGVRC